MCSLKGVRKMRRIKWMVMFLAIISLLSGCQLFSSLSPEQIVEKALAATEEPQISYYGEMTFKGIGTIGEGLIENVTVKEWYSEQQNRSEIMSDEGEVIIVSNEGKVQLYLVDEAVVYETIGEDIDVFSINPKEQLNNLLTLLRDTHDVEMIGKEEVAKRQTHHLKATTRADSNSILGDLELWIDEEYWIPLKTKSKSGQIEVEMKYDVIDFGVTLSDDIFILDVPEGVVTENIDEPVERNVIDKEEIASVIGQPIYIIEEKDNWEIESISHVEGEQPDAYTLMEIDYTYNGIPGLSLVITKNEEIDDTLTEEFAEILNDISEKITVRDTEAIVIDSPEIRMLSWQEQNLEYNIHVLNPAIQMEDITKLIESMIKTK